MAETPDDIHAKYKIEIAGEQYFCVFGSDVDRDGVYLELSSLKNGTSGSAIAEVFYSDVSGAMTLTTFDNAIPVETVEWLVARAKERLPPKPQS